MFALMVFFSHTHNLSKDPGSLFNRIYHAYLSEGFIGVGFFFVLSGFILSYNYAARMSDGRTTKQRFWWLRFSKIYPSYLLALLLAIPLKLYDLTADTLVVLAKLATHGLLLQSFFAPAFAFYFNPPAWSISDEAFFYLLFPFLIGAIKSLRKGLSVLTILLVVMLILVNIYHADWYSYLFYINPVLRCSEFILGIVLFRIFAERTGSSTSHFIASILEIAAIILFGIFLYLHQRVDIVYRFSIFYWLPISLIIYIFSWQKGILSNFLSARLFVFLGEISFSFYLLHILAEYYIGILARRIEWHYSPGGFLFVWFTTTLIAATLCFKYIETPARKKLRMIQIG